MNKYIFLKKNIIQFAQKIKRASKHARSACEEASVKLKLFWFLISFLKFWHISFWTLITHHYYLFLVLLKLIICVYFINQLTTTYYVVANKIIHVYFSHMTYLINYVTSLYNTCVDDLISYHLMGCSKLTTKPWPYSRVF